MIFKMDLPIHKQFLGSSFTDSPQSINIPVDTQGIQLNNELKSILMVKGSLKRPVIFVRKGGKVKRETNE